MQNKVQLHPINLYLCVLEDAVRWTSELSCGQAWKGSVFTWTIGFMAQRGCMNPAFLLPKLYSSLNCWFWIQTGRNEIAFSLRHIWLVFPTVHISQTCSLLYNEMFACTRNPMSELREAAATFTVWQENKSARSWISAHQSEARWLS